MEALEKTKQETSRQLLTVKQSALSQTASRFSMDPQVLLNTLKNTVFKGATNEQLAALVVVANEHGLNPFTREIYAFPDKSGGIQAVVGVDGWIRIITGHERFDGDGSDISIRFPDDTAARDLIRTAKVPIVTTSANISGYPPSTDAQQVLMDFKGKINMILDGGSTRFRSPSTVLKLKDGGFEIVRHGIISEAMIRSCLENTLVKV